LTGNPSNLFARGLARLDGFWFAPVPALRLAVLRVLIVGFGLIWLLAMGSTLRDTMRLSASHFRPVGVVTLIDEPLGFGVALALYLLCIAAGVATLLGWKYRVSAPVHALTLLWITSYRNSWGMVFHSENLWVMHTLILACLPAADTWSLDARRQGASSHEPHGRYGWGPKLMATVAALTYVLAGIAKLRNAGGEWLDGQVLLSHVGWDNLRKLELGSLHSPLGAGLARWPAVFAPLAWLSMVFEFGAPLSLLSRRLAWVWAIGMWSFHLGVAALMAIVFPYPVVGIAFAPLFAIEQPVLALAARVGARPGTGYSVLARLLPSPLASQLVNGPEGARSCPPD
jgi:hypothetical protein